MNIRTFMSGVISLLPIAATLAIVAWAGGFIYSYFGPGSAIGRLLTSLGLGLVGSPLVAYLVGLVIVAILIYALGVMVESSVAPRLYGGLDTMMQRIPLVGMVSFSLVHHRGSALVTRKRERCASASSACSIARMPRTSKA